MDPVLVCTTAVVLIIWNWVVFLTYGADKRRAKKNKWRIPESVLMAMAFFMGAAGALFGMRYYRHKTKHLKFKIGVPLCLVFNIAIIVMMVLDAYKMQH